MANDNIELMTGEPETAIRKLAVPIMISMILTATYNIIDGIWVAGLGQEAIAGIGFVTPIFMVLNGASVGLGNGATSSISRFIGAKNHEKANQSATHSLIIFVAASIMDDSTSSGLVDLLDSNLVGLLSKSGIACSYSSLILLDICLELCLEHLVLKSLCLCNENTLLCTFNIRH